MSFFDVLSLAGGLALFLYGMHLLGEGLSNASGGRMESILEKLTNNPVKAVLVGAGVTAVIQSSSATTVMVVGFVNSGIMKLQQAVGIIMGANIGTTMTAWILSLAGIESDSFFIKLLKPSSFSPVLALIGVFIIMLSKKEKQKNIATIMLGFAILMFGMDTMSAAVRPLAQVPEFTGILTRFTNPVLGVLAGMVLTAIIQSSSASVGILQALCMTGSISYQIAVPIIMGQNIGTCVTAMISGIGANKNARRAALVHLYFNIIGTVVFMIGFYALYAIFRFPFVQEAATPAGIAVVHSTFNVIATLILMPFSKGLVKLATLTIRDEAGQTPDGKKEEPGESELDLLDVRFLDSPSFAVDQSKRAAVRMAQIAENAVNLSLELLEGYDPEKAGEVERLEKLADTYEDELGTYLVKLSSRNLLESDSHVLSEILHCINDFERISDHALHIRERAGELFEKKLEFSNKAKKELKVMEDAVREILHLTVESFAKEDLAKCIQVEPLEEVIDDLDLEIKKRHVKRLQKGKCTIELGFILQDLTADLERISDHCSNVAVCLLEVSEDEYETHAYLGEVRKADNLDFQGKVMVYRKKYVLPE